MKVNNFTTQIIHNQLFTQWLSWMDAHPNWAKELLTESTDRKKVNDDGTPVKLTFEQYLEYDDGADNRYEPYVNFHIH